jgi:ParB/RepB/Spo0J family partition protein
MKEQETIAAPPNGSDHPPAVNEDPNCIAPSPFNKNRDDETDPAFQELLDSVRTHGIIQPLVVRPVVRPAQFKFVPAGVALGWRITRNGTDVKEFPKTQEAKAREAWDHYYGRVKFELIAGERRWRAAKASKLKTVPIIVREADDLTVLELQTEENAKRKDLSPIQQAEKYQQLLAEYAKAGLVGEKGIARLCEKIGKAKATIYEALRLIKLPDPVKQAVSSGKLPASHAGLIAQLEDAPEIQQKLLKEITTKSDRYEYGKQRDDKGVLSFRDSKQLVDEQRELTKSRKEWEAKATAHRAKGGQVLTEEENSKHVSQYGAACNGYVTAAEFTYDYNKGNQYAGQTYGKLMGKHAPKATLAHDAKWKPLLVYKKSEAVAAIEKNGHKKKAVKSSSSSSSNNSYEKQQAARKQRAERMKPVVAKAHELILQAASKPKPKFPWSIFLEWLEDYVSTGLSKSEIAKIGSQPMQQVLALLVKAMLGKTDGYESLGWDEYQGKWDEVFSSVAKHYGVNLAKLEKDYASPPVQTPGKSKSKPQTKKKRR